jgi:hypothetical protein
MKSVKIVAIATAITIALILACGIATAAVESDTYEVNAVVIEMRIAFPGVWEIIAADERGEKWGWYSDNGDGEYWHIGDLVRLTMLNLRGEDEVMDVYLLGKLTPSGVAEWMRWK